MDFYNDNDPHIVSWLETLIANRLIPHRRVDATSISELKHSSLSGYGRCHFFAGIGGWAHALDLAGWPATRNVWTASLPCQPWSNCGDQLGEEDERHLWPDMFRLIKIGRPATLFGEQVVGAISKGWLDAIFADLEAIDYACAATVIPASSIGAFHERKRIFFVADASSEGWGGICGRRAVHTRHRLRGAPQALRHACFREDGHGGK